MEKTWPRSKVKRHIFYCYRNLRHAFGHNSGISRKLAAVSCVSNITQTTNNSEQIHRVTGAIRHIYGETCDPLKCISLDNMLSIMRCVNSMDILVASPIAFASTESLALISLKRFYHIVKPNNCRQIFTARRTSAMIMAAWLIALLVQLPYVAAEHM